MAPPDYKDDSARLRSSFLLAAAFTLLLWLVKSIELVLALDFVSFGIYPRRADALAGIVLAPLLHGSLSHLFSNTPPLLILGTALLYGYPKSSRLVIPILYLGSGLAVWLFARGAWHIGASGFTSGMLFFILTIGVLRWDTRAIVLAMIVFLLYGGMIWGIFPGDPSISYESHLAGAFLGTILAFLLRQHDPLPPQKRYSWEDEDEANVDDNNGDELNNDDTRYRQPLPTPARDDK